MFDEPTPPRRHRCRDEKRDNLSLPLGNEDTTITQVAGTPDQLTNPTTGVTQTATATCPAGTRIIGVDFTANASNNNPRPYPINLSINPATDTATVSFFHPMAATGFFTLTARAICAAP